MGRGPSTAANAARFACPRRTFSGVGEKVSSKSKIRASGPAANAASNATLSLASTNCSTFLRSNAGGMEATCQSPARIRAVEGSKPGVQVGRTRRAAQRSANKG